MIQDPEDEAFNEIERQAKMRQEAVRSLNRKRQIENADRAFDEQYPIWKRNQVIEEVAEHIEKLEQEPVAYLCENAVGHKYFRWKKPSSAYKPVALYTIPPPCPTCEALARTVMMDQTGRDA